MEQHVLWGNTHPDNHTHRGQAIKELFNKFAERTWIYCLTSGQPHINQALPVFQFDCLKLSPPLYTGITLQNVKEIILFGEVQIKCRTEHEIDKEIIKTFDEYVRKLSTMGGGASFGHMELFHSKFH